MLTIKHINGDGEERVMSVLEVEYQSALAQQACQATRVGYTGSTGRCRFIWPAADKRELDDEFVYEGKVYVMNEVGKTVQQYDLGGWALQQSGAVAGTITLGGAQLGNSSQIGDPNLYPSPHSQRLA